MTPPQLFETLLRTHACLSALRSAHELPVEAIGHELVAAARIALLVPRGSYDARSRALFTAKILEAEATQPLQPDRREDFLDRVEAFLDRLAAMMGVELAPSAGRHGTNPPHPTPSP